mmetsp:Transcript_20622/g.21413  ORF Transcript_20622/g.21413 Transcript_20622/m.21413 type:complete len:281 (+) Transcript_20622:65-907(+)
MTKTANFVILVLLISFSLASTKKNHLKKNHSKGTYNLDIELTEDEEKVQGRSFVFDIPRFISIADWYPHEWVAADLGVFDLKGFSSHDSDIFRRYSLDYAWDHSEKDSDERVEATEAWGQLCVHLRLPKKYCNLVEIEDVRLGKRELDFALCKTGAELYEVFLDKDFDNLTFDYQYMSVNYRKDYLGRLDEEADYIWDSTNDGETIDRDGALAMFETLMSDWTFKGIKASDVTQKVRYYFHRAKNMDRKKFDNMIKGTYKLYLRTIENVLRHKNIEVLEE